MLFERETVNPSPLHPSDPLVLYEYWTVEADGTGATPLLSGPQQQRLAANTRGRDFGVGAVAGWCGARAVLVQAGITTDQGTPIGGTLVVSPGRRPAFVPDVELRSASEDGNAFILQDRAQPSLGYFLLTLRHRP